MADRPENRNPLAGTPSVNRATIPSAEPTLPLSTDTDPKALPLVDYDLIKVAAESEKRERLLAAVAVDEHGIARCVNPVSGSETILVAVRVDDARAARKVPLKMAEGGALAFELPDDRPSRIGFFVGYRANQSVTGVLRMGLYPGVPLTTQSVSDGRMNEVMYGIKGVKTEEVDEHRWAQEVGLFTDLGFDPKYTRGMFNRNHKPNASSDTWQESPLVVVPDDMRDMVRHYAEGDVKKDEFQILFYGEKPRLDLSSLLERSAGWDDRPQTYEMRSFGGTTRGLGIGFGDAVSRQARTTATEIDSLQGAFKVITVPAPVAK